VKAAAPHQANRAKLVIREFEKNLQKCKEWLKPDAGPGIKETFHIERLDYALALLVDLTDGGGIRGLYRSAINENELFNNGIIACLISPRPVRNIPEHDGLQAIKANETYIPSTHQKSKGLIYNAETGTSHTSKHLEIALQAVLQCEETGEQQGVEVPLTSWDEVYRFKAEVISHIRKYNEKTSNPIRHASPWAWRTESKGVPLTENGRKYGVEMRCSFFPKGKQAVTIVV
jgi:hypothetical protein